MSMMPIIITKVGDEDVQQIKVNRTDTFGEIFDKYLEMIGLEMTNSEDRAANYFLDE
jgi:hypothetical protein